MHSKQLQTNNTGIYESFFAQQKIIFSAPFVLSRSGDAEAVYSGISIKQKIPLRMYIGINSDQKKGIHFGNIIYKDFSEGKYLETSMKEYAPYFNEIDKYIKNSGIQGEVGYRITILSELPRGAGMGFDSIFCLLLSTAIYRLQNNNSILHIDESSITEDINNNKSSIYHIARYAHLLESQIRGYQYNSGSLLTSLCPGKFPIISFSEDTQNTGKKELFTMQDYKCFIYPLNTLFPEIGEIPYSPIDFGVIYSGRPTLTEHVSRDSSHGEFATLMKFVEDTFSDSIATSNAQRKPKFYKEFIKGYEKGNYHSINSLLGYNSFEILQSLRNIFRSGFSEEDIKKLLLAITKTRHAHNAVKKASSNLTALITCLQQFFGHRPDLLGVSYNDTNIMGGSLFFVTPIEGLRKNILNTLRQAQMDFPGVELLYANWLDGIEENGIICEQDLLQQKTSQYVDTNMLVLELPDKNYIFGSYDNLIQQKDIDIILDTVHMKIYTYGQKLTSKELHSQTGTIEMLLTALDNIGIDISNKDLPISSYAKSKNDMVGKIVLPLVKLVKQKLNKELPLECYGGMYDYFLRLKKHNVKFGVVKKLAETVK